MTWNQTTLNNRIIQTITLTGNNVFATTYEGSIYKSTDNGINWTMVFSGSMPSFHSLIVKGNNVFAGSEGGLDVLTNNGNTFSLTSLNRGVYSLAIDSTDIYCGTQSFGVYKSTDNGVSWIVTSLNSYDIFSLLVNGGKIFAGTGISGVKCSTDKGISWYQTEITGDNIHALAAIGNTVFAAVGFFGVYTSTNNGINWSQNNLNCTSITSMICKNNYLFAGEGMDGL